MPLEFTTFDVCKSLDIKRETLKDWLNKGFIKASRSTTDSRGQKSFFDGWELHCIYLFREIVNKGMSRELASRIVDTIRPLNPINTNEHIRNKEYLIVVQTKTGHLRAQFYSWNDCPDLKSIATPDEFENIFVWNFKPIIEDVEKLTSDSSD